MKIRTAIAAGLVLLLFNINLDAAEPRPANAVAPEPANAVAPEPANAAAPEPGNGDIVGLDAAGPAMAKGTPAMWFGVKSCSQYVIFLVMDDGHMWQVDEDHHPKDMDAFLKSIAGLRHQLKVIPCAETL